MSNTDNIQLFEDQPIRTAWNEDEPSGACHENLTISSVPPAQHSMQMLSSA